MIKEMKGTPASLVAFEASDEVTKADFDRVIMPAVNDLIRRTGKLNYLIVLRSPFRKFKLGNWLREAMLKLNQLDKWNKAAFVSTSEEIQSFGQLFSRVVPGEFKGFTIHQMDTAINWASEQNAFTPTFQKTK